MEFDAAVLFEVGGPLAIERVAVDWLRPDDVLVRVHASGLCRTLADVDKGFAASEGGSLVRAVIQMER